MQDTGVPTDNEIFGGMRVQQRANAQQRISFSHNSSPQTRVQLRPAPLFIPLPGRRLENKTAWPGIGVQSLNTMPKLQRSSMVFYWSSADRYFAYDFRCTIHPVRFHLFISLNPGYAMLNSEVKRPSDPQDSQRSLALPAHSLVMAQPTLPHETCPHPCKQEPASLDGQRLHKVRSL